MGEGRGLQGDEDCFTRLHYLYCVGNCSALLKGSFAALRMTGCVVVILSAAKDLPQADGTVTRVE